MEDDPGEQKPLLRSISSDDPVLDTPQSTEFYDVSSKKRRISCAAVILTELLERVAFFGITGNLVLFLIGEPFNWASDRAAHLFFGFTAMSYFFSVVGGLIADSALGRFKTICISLIIYMFGVAFFVMLGAASLPKYYPFCKELCGYSETKNESNEIGQEFEHHSPYSDDYDPHTQILCLMPILLGIILVAMGTGSVRANLSPFGAEQMKREGHDAIRIFFNWFYWASNIGSLLALGGITYIQQEMNFFIGNLIAASALVVALIIFMCGRVTYLTRKPTGSVLPNTYRIIVDAFKRRHQRKEIIQSNATNGHLLNLYPKITFLDMAKIRYGGSFHESMVEDVKSLKKVIGVFLLLIPYWMVYYQMETTFVIQGFHMKLGWYETKNGKTTIIFQIPIAWLTLFDVIVVIILMPFLDRIIYPFLIRRGYNISLFYRIFFGMIFSVLAVLAAGFLEVARTKCLHGDYPNCKAMNQTIRNSTYEAADMWIFYQIPQYVLIGISEVLASVASLEYAYSHAPKSMQGLIMGLYCLSNGIGSLCGSGLMALVILSPFHWFNNSNYGSIDDSQLKVYFFALAGIQLVATIIFFIVKFRSNLNYKDRGPPTPARNGHVQRIRSSGTER